MIAVLEPAQLRTARLILEPVPLDTARRVVAGDLSGLKRGEGWPHADTRSGLRMALRGGHTPGWFVFRDGLVIGDCGVHGEPQDGVVELGFGLAEPYRGQGYGSELVAALVGWLSAQPAVTTVAGRARRDNIASHRVMERAGMARVGSDGDYVRFERCRIAQSAGP
ncbi:MAG: GNAT family N-acetyltransferase [Solirubrobacterales bacterium]|nr:GNAT family N-acetyltransferase [Solirubrobacterales bacterium]